MRCIWKLNSRLPSHFSTLFIMGITIAIVATALLDTDVVAQRRRRQRTPARRNISTAIDYSHFSHATKKHQAACNTCHKVPTENWKKVRDYPDVADFPGHDACVSCHRAQFFKGAKPTICSDCHTKVSPRDEARFAFRNPGGARQFVIEFPHDKHQDVIAQVFRKLRFETPPQFVRAGFRNSELFVDEKTKHYNNCEICHQPRSAASAIRMASYPSEFAPAADTFKAEPSTHASCFNCHWGSQQPVSDNCGGCHKLATQPYVVLDSTPRISLKFRHGREQHTQECTTCHINITKSATLRTLKPDVPITACLECHNKGPVRFDVTNELLAIDKNRDFTCTYCHTSDVGRRDPPASHYLISGLPPKKRKDVK
ncbi:MAG TPA: hypothetical protein DC047_04630 [Blastocatellia bacterium]|nr:hypothetical protein [Blastocatellia bacterium]